MDAAQGVEAQTLANVYLALDHDLDVMPVINKVDLPSAQPDEVVKEIEDVIGIEAEDAPRISAKTGLTVDQVLEQIVQKIPAPAGDPKAPLQALIFDALYDSYKGVIVFCRIKEGTVRVGDPILMMATGAQSGSYRGQFTLEQGSSFRVTNCLPAWSATSVRASKMCGIPAWVIRPHVRVTNAAHPCELSRFPERRWRWIKVNPMVIHKTNGGDRHVDRVYGGIRRTVPNIRIMTLCAMRMEKLQINDAARCSYEPARDASFDYELLGFGFRCGFLGLLHLEIVQERLEREFHLDLVTTAPGVIYKVHKTNGEVIDLTNPSNLPDPSEIEYMEEPVVSAEIMVTSEYVGAIMTLCQERRGVYNGFARTLQRLLWLSI